jgi:hypothetical protein
MTATPHVRLFVADNGFMIESSDSAQYRIKELLSKIKQASCVVAVSPDPGADEPIVWQVAIQKGTSMNTIGGVVRIIQERFTDGDIEYMQSLLTISLPEFLKAVARA